MDGELGDPGSELGCLCTRAQEAVGAGARLDADECAGVGVREQVTARDSSGQGAPDGVGLEGFRRFVPRRSGLDPPLGDHPAGPGFDGMCDDRILGQHPRGLAVDADNSDAIVVERQGFDGRRRVAVRVE